MSVAAAKRVQATVPAFEDWTQARLAHFERLADANARRFFGLPEGTGR